MNHGDHVRLLRDGVHGAGPTWADLGSGTGAFTLALADLLGPDGVIHSVDRNAGALREQARQMGERFPHVTLYQTVADFTAPLPLAALDGVVMANSLHFQRDKASVLALVRGYVRDGGRLVLVEYDTDVGNPWVPFPLSYGTWERLASQSGFRGTRRLTAVPSRFLGAIYSAASIR
ncbi:MAG: class I SAM-dependent methyltransferase [Candidatus Limnocylindrales bacterium]